MIEAPALTHSTIAFAWSSKVTGGRPVTPRSSYHEIGCQPGIAASIATFLPIIVVLGWAGALKCRSSLLLTIASASLYSSFILAVSYYSIYMHKIVLHALESTLNHFFYLKSITWSEKVNNSLSLISPIS